MIICTRLTILLSLILFLLCSTVTITAASDKTSCQATTADMTSTTPAELMKLSKPTIVDILGGIYEHSAWVAEALVATDDYKTITTVSALAQAMKEIVDKASPEQQLALLQAHPDLGVKLEQLKTLTKESQEEQSKAGLQNLTPDELAQFTALNEQYKKTFDFPFILAVRNAGKETILAALAGRVNRSRPAEFQTALQQVHKIAWMRLLSKLDVSTDSQGFLTVHVLDTANGIPAANMKITLHRLSPEPADLGTFVTNHDGRLDVGPALEGAGRRRERNSNSQDMQVGVYEWTFYAGDYFASQGTFSTGTPFLDTIPIRFGIDNPDDHYHVPLLVSPWSFSTYRGS